MHRDQVVFGKRVYWNNRQNQGVLVALVGQTAHIAVDNYMKTDVRWFEIPLADVEAEGPSAADISDWRYEVTNGDTALGLADWLEHRAEAASMDSDVLPEGLYLDRNTIRDAQDHAWLELYSGGPDDPVVWRETIISRVCEALGVEVPRA